MCFLLVELWWKLTFLSEAWACVTIPSGLAEIARTVLAFGVLTASMRSPLLTCAVQWLSCSSLMMIWAWLLVLMVSVVMVDLRPTLMCCRVIAPWALGKLMVTCGGALAVNSPVLIGGVESVTMILMELLVLVWNASDLSAPVVEMVFF